MKIEHIALYVNDLEGARDFLPAISAGSPAGCTTTKQRGSALIS